MSAGASFAERKQTHRSDDPPCLLHGAVDLFIKQIKEVQDDHEDRLRDKKNRIQHLEAEAKNMNEKLDLMIVSQKETKTSLDSMVRWQIGVATGFAVVLFILEKWDTIAKFLN